MPTISEFNGILIQMYTNEHPPMPFHVIYNEFKASIVVGTWQVYAGEPPNRIYNLVVEWAGQHERELRGNWDLLQDGRAPERIKGL